VNLTEFNAFDLGELDDVETESSPGRPSRAEIEEAVRTLIAATGYDASSLGLPVTPARVARGLSVRVAGYRQGPI
jgi:GTP cyclohydrolase I